MKVPKCPEPLKNDKKSMKNIIVIDRILTRIQEMIFYRTRSVCTQILYNILGIEQSLIRILPSVCQIDTYCKCTEEYYKVYDLNLILPSQRYKKIHTCSNNSYTHELNGEIYRLIILLLKNPLFVMNYPQPMQNIINFDVSKLLDQIQCTDSVTL
jgi:hypothetical protein